MPPQRSAGTEPEAEHPMHAGQYLLEAQLGSGGMGVVHLARSASGLRLAVKVVHAEFSQDPEFRGRFKQEVAAARRVSGAFTAPVVDADPEAEHPWMATLFIPGPTLAEHVKRNGALDAAPLRQLMAGLAEGLRDIHRAGVVHRDLKPSNVLLADDGPKVIDFGISRPSDSELHTETGKLIGTPPFMAPEQFRSPREVGPAADVFALGSLIVHAATGSGPFNSDSPYLVAYQVVHDEPDLTGVPEELADLVARCLAKEPEDRPTPDELMTALKSVSASYDTQAFIPGQRGASGRGARAARLDAPVPARAGRPLVPAPTPGPDPDPTHRRDRALPGDGAHRRDGRSGPPEKVPGRRWRLPVAAAASVLAAVVIGVLALHGGSDVRVPDKDTDGRPSGNPFQPWDLHLGAPGIKAVGLPQCTYTPHELYCVRPGVLAASVDPADGRVLWSRGDTHRGNHRSTAPPVLSGGLLQVLSGDGLRLQALDPATGTTRWSHDVARYDGGVTHVGGVVLLTGPGGVVTALDAATGKEKWRHAVPGQPAPHFVTYGDGVAYTATAAGNGTRVDAVDPRTGSTRWQRRLDGTLSVVGAHDGAVWFTSIGGNQYTNAVVRYDVSTRSVRRVTLPVQLLSAQAVVRGDTVYLLAGGGTLVAVDTRASAQLWRAETTVSTASAPVVAGRRLYLTAADGRLLSVDTTRGTLLGQTRARLGDAQGSLISSIPAPVAADGKVYSSAPDGSLFAVDGSRPSTW
ncbi:serine/threonine-protein kinase [Streptomyces sp. NBC_01571]|uniref:serine/threonine-protein kinase n=1 Tax=Streptomyces sp. NBC_01571 TaxID=2975883 RepID=UPI0022577BBD|nr:serine/threonine-protein kinase [Streptomyces sp. NBC_01571]MCX4576670.1 serine/threonine-protein kinase [Streptomyces sp. NBC_01571]